MRTYITREVQLIPIKMLVSKKDPELFCKAAVFSSKILKTTIAQVCFFVIP